MNELWKYSALELRRMIVLKEIKPSELMQAVFIRMETVNPKVNAFCTIARNSAMMEALAADEQIARGSPQGALFGIPVSAKDLILSKGIRTTFGSRIYETYIPDQDEVAVARLKAAGAILLGKTNTSEFGYKAVTDNPLWGTTRNPWDLEKTSAGSSGGAAAAVAAGMGPLALGSDGGGSIRAPASFCGVFGLKPSQGRIPLNPLPRGWETLYRRLIQLGPLTRTVADAALMMEVMSGPDQRDPLSLPGEKFSIQEQLGKGVLGLKMAWSADLGYAVVDPKVKQKVEGAAKIFSDLGGELEEVSLTLPSLHDAFQMLFAAECAAAIGGRMEDGKEKMDPGLVRFLQIGQKASAVEYVRAANRCHLLWEFLHPFFEKYDLLLTPTLPVAPFSLGMDWPREVSGEKVHPLNFLAFTYPFNLTGYPAASVPCGWSEDGLPIGLQIVGKRWEEVTVLRAAAAFEEARPWKNKWPNLIEE